MDASDRRQLREALIDLNRLMNRSQLQAALLKEAGVPLDRALLPLLIRIERKGRIGVVELAESVGRDYTSVSRQLAKLEQLRLIARRPSQKDARVREAVLTDKGKSISDALDAARERWAARTVAMWSDKDRKDLVRLIRKLVNVANIWEGGE